MLPTNTPTGNNQGGPKSALSSIVAAVTQPLISPLEMLIGKGKIQDRDRSRIFIALVLVLLAPFVVSAAPENSNVKIFLFIVFILLIPLMWGQLFVEWFKRSPVAKGKTTLPVIVFSDSKARGVAKATVHVTGAISRNYTTDETGLINIEFPSNYIERNLKINVLAEKKDLGQSETIEIQLSGQTDAKYIQLLPSKSEQLDVSIKPFHGVDREGLRFGLHLGWEIGRYEFTYDSIFEEAKRHAPEIKAQIDFLLTQDKFPYSLDNLSYQELIKLVLNYYAVQDTSKHGAILLGISAMRASLVGASQNQSHNVEMTELAFSGLKDIDPLLLPNKDKFFGMLLKKKPESIVGVLEFIDNYGRLPE